MPSDLERFVSVEEAIRFVPVSKRHLLALARKGIAGAYPVDPKAKRKVWVFRLSELAAAIEKNNVPALPALGYDPDQPSVLEIGRS